MEIIVVVVACVVVGLVYLNRYCVSCGEPDIVFVLPRNFAGAFVVVQDSHGQEGKCVNGVVTINVPLARVVRVKSLESFQNMHKEFIATMSEDGASRPTMVNLDPSPSESTLRCLGTAQRSVGGMQSKQRIKYFLGTEADARATDLFAIPVDDC